MNLISDILLGPWQWAVFILCGLLIGMAKTGLSGAGLMIVPIMAGLFGSKASVGIVLPMLLMADVFAVLYYNRYTSWRIVLPLLPWTLPGILSGVFVGNKINNEQFTFLLALIVFTGIVLILLQDFFGKNFSLPNKWWLAALLGFAGGFTTMVGNAAGSVMSIYLLAMCLPKNNFIGTGAWFFFIVNLIKVPFHIFSWHTINSSSIIIDLLVLPAIIAGAFFGIKIVRIMPEKIYRYFIIVSTVVAALFLLV